MKRFAITLFTAVAVLAASINASAQDKGENRQVSDFSSIASSGPFNVHVNMGNTESLKIDADASLLDKIETEVKNGSLQIKIERSYWKAFENVKKIDIYITAKTLHALANSGSGTITVDGQINADDFTAAMSGSGSIATSVKADQLHAVISGSGNIKLNGGASDVNVVISGSGQLQAKAFHTETAKFTITGSGSAFINAEKELTSSIIGSGSIRYTGNAQTHTSKIGSGSVTKVD